MQNKTNNKVQSVKAQKAEKVQTKKAQVKEQAVDKEAELKNAMLDKIVTLIKEAQKTDNNIKVQKVTGYISVKYVNKVLFELHAKKKSYSHLTFSQQQTAFKILKDNKLITRVVPKSYGWKYDTECTLTADFVKHFASILKSVIAEAVEARNLKAIQETKKQAKKTA